MSYFGDHIVLAALFAFAVLFAAAALSVLRRVRIDKLEQIEQNLDVLLKELGLAERVWPHIDDRTRFLAQQGRKIEAVRNLRTATGLQLFDARLAVEEKTGRRSRGFGATLRRIQRKSDVLSSDERGRLLLDELKTRWQTNARHT